MIFLEATMIVIGLAAVIISFRISDKKVSNTAGSRYGSQYAKV